MAPPPPSPPPPFREDPFVLSGKPPLPATATRAPPRVVGASAKRRGSFASGAGAAAQPSPAPHSGNHGTIDSGDALPRSMEPMGLIETDLDTEVTVITSGAHVKTRSLMNLGGVSGEPPSSRRSLAAPQHAAARPHKSMEFLLDKQNLKVVEVSRYITLFHLHALTYIFSSSCTSQEHTGFR